MPFQQIFDTFGNFLLLVIGFSLVIFIHEFGHFIVAKWAGIQVDQFAIGFGQAALAWRKGLGLRVGTTTPEYEKRLADGANPASMSETEYRLNWFPLGGYVKMLGQDDLDQAHTSTDPRSYTSKSVGARMAVISAGVILNMISAFILFVGCFMYGISYPAPLIGQVAVNSPAAKAILVDAEAHGITTPGLQMGDRVLSVDGQKARRFTDLQLAAVMSKPGDTIEFRIDRAGIELILNVEPVKNVSTGMMAIGIAPASSLKIDPNLAKADQANFLESEKARWGITEANLKPGMILARINGQPIQNYWELQKVVQAIENDFEVELEFRDPENTATPAVVTSAKVMPEFMDGLTITENILGFAPLIRIAGRGADQQSNALDAGMKIGDTIAKINNINWPTNTQLLEIVRSHAGEDLEFVMLRDGQRIDITVKVSKKGAIGIQMSRALNVMRVNTINTPRVAPNTAGPDPAATENPPGDSPTPTEPAVDIWAAAQITPALPAGSQILSINGKQINDWREFKAALTDQTNPALENSTVQLSVALALPGNPIEAVKWVIPQDQVAQLHQLGWSLEPRIFAYEETLLQASNPIQALEYGIDETWRMLAMTYLTFDRIARRTVDAKNIKGPIGIAQIGTQVASKGLPELIMFMAIISVNLAVLNFLPIPMMDGGHFLFLIIEKLKGSPVSPAIQNLASIGGLVILGGLFLFVTFNDVLNLINGRL